MFVRVHLFSYSVANPDETIPWRIIIAIFGTYSACMH